MIQKIFIALVMVALAIVLITHWRADSGGMAEDQERQETDNESNVSSPEGDQNPSANTAEDIREEQPPTSIERVDEELIGSWRATDEAGYAVDFLRDGTLRYSYASGAAIEEGTYDTYSGRNELPERVREEARPYEEDAVFLREAFDSNEYYFVVLSITGESLERVDLVEGERETLERIGN